VAKVSMKQLLEAGVHFGHQTRRWNPKMKSYIFTERNGIYIIDLQKTVKLIDVTYNFVRDMIADGGSIIFVGTKKQAQESIRFEAERCGAHYVNHRWLGGMLTNFNTIRKRIDRMIKLEEMENDGTFERLTKKEVLTLRNEKERLDKFLSGIRNMKKLPDAVYVADPRKEKIAVSEARKLDIPVIAILDTNCDPDEVDYLIPGNDDAIRAVKLITSVIADAVLEGKQISEQPDVDEEIEESEEVEKPEQAAVIEDETAVIENEELILSEDLPETGDENVVISTDDSALSTAPVAEVVAAEADEEAGQAEETETNSNENEDFAEKTGEKSEEDK